ncbi:hypothetical protein ES706_05201 [subsurface metagenome]
MSIIVEPMFLYRCADLLCKLAEKVKEDQVNLTPELVDKWATGFSAAEMRNLGEILKLLSLMMHALTITRDSVIEGLTKRIIELEKEKERGCCDEWWASLPSHLKEYIHYYHYDIIEKLCDFPATDLTEMHDFRFKVESPLKDIERRQQQWK